MKPGINSQSLLVACVLAILWVTPLVEATFPLNENFTESAGQPPLGPTTAVTLHNWIRIRNSQPPGTLQAWFIPNSSPPFPAQDGGAQTYAAANFEDVAGNNTISSWLISPVLPLAVGNTISFYTRTIGPVNFPDRLELRISGSGSSTNVGATPTSVGVFTRNPLTINPGLTLSGYPTVWTHFSYTLAPIDIGSGSGRFAFRYFVTNGGPDGPNSNYIGIDTIQYTKAAPSTIPAGEDCWTTQCGTTVSDFKDSPIPCGFFDPGSDPFDGSVLWGGGDPGDIDTRVRRNANINFGATLPDTQNVPIEIVSLNLVSCTPITVRYCNGLPNELWNVSVDLSPAAIPPPGLMTVTKTHPNGGDFTSQFYVQPRFIFTRISDAAVRVLDTGAEGILPVLLDSTSPAPWVHNATIPVGPVICGVNFVPGVQEANVPSPPGAPFCVTTLQCCIPVNHSDQPPFTCNPPPCPVGRHNHQTSHQCFQCGCGACCMSDGTCVEFAGFDPAGACTMAGGTFLGMGSSCQSADGDTIPDSYETNNCCSPSSCALNSLCSKPTDPTRADTDGDGLNDDVDPVPCNRCLPLNAPNRPAICDQFDPTLPGDGDCDNDGICDLCEIQAGTSNDCNDNGVPDECEPDCNNNNLPDDYDVNCGTSPDVNGNGVPDECEAGSCPTCSGDVNGDGNLDGRDIRCFILCLLDGGGPGCNCSCADMDGNAVVSTADISLFVGAILAKPSDCGSRLEVAAPVIGDGPGRLKFNVSVRLGGPFNNGQASGEGSLRLDTSIPGQPRFFDVFWHSDGNPVQNIPPFTVQIPGATPIQDNGAQGTTWTLNGSVDINNDANPGSEPDANVQVHLKGPPLAQLGQAAAHYDLNPNAPGSLAIVLDPVAFGGLPPGTQIPIIQHPVKIKKYCIYVVRGVAGPCPVGVDPDDFACVECDSRQKLMCPGGPVGNVSFWWLVPPPPGPGGCRIALELFIADCTGCSAEHTWRFGGWELFPKP